MPNASPTKYPAKELVCRLDIAPSLDPSTFRTTLVYAVPVLRMYVIFPDDSHISGVKIEELKPVYALVYEPLPPSSSFSPLERITEVSLKERFDQKIVLGQETIENSSALLSGCLPILAMPPLYLALMCAYFSLTQ